MLTQAVEYGNYPEVPINLTMLENKIYEAIYKASMYPEINLKDSKRTEHDNACRTYREIISRLEKQ